MIALPCRAEGDLVVFADDLEPARPWAIRARPAARAWLVRYRLPDGAPEGPAGGRLVVHADIAPPVGGYRAAPLEGARFSLRTSLAGSVSVEALPADGSVVVAVDLPWAMAEAVGGVMEGASVVPVILTWEGVVRVRLPGGLEVGVDEAAMAAALDASAVGDAPPPGFAGLLRLSWSGGMVAPEVAYGWVWSELRTRRAAGLPLSFRVPGGAVVAWPVRLEGGLERAEGAVQHVDLRGDATTRELDVQLVGELHGVEAVEVRVNAGEERVFRLTTAAPERMVVPIHVSVEWASRAVVGGVAGAWGPTRRLEVGSSAVLVTAPTMRARSLEVSAASLDLERRWARVDVGIRWVGPTGERETGRLSLHAGAVSARWSSTAVASGPGELFAQVTWVGRGGAVLEGAERAVAEDLLVEDPLPGDLRVVEAVATGPGWGPGALAMVDLELPEAARPYRDTRQVDGEQAARWELPLAGGAPLRYRWRAHLRTVDGHFSRTEWAESSDEVLVLAMPVPVGSLVRVVPVWLNATRWRAVRLSISPRGGGDVERVVTSPLPLDIALEGELPAAWSAVWQGVDGGEVTASGVVSAPVLVLPRPEVR